MASVEPWVEFFLAGAFDRTWLNAAAALLLFGLLILLGSVFSLLRLRLFSFVFRILFGAALLVAGAAAGFVAVGTAGYQALTREETAATIHVEPAGPQRFNATVRLPDGRTERFSLAGDEIYVDAHILKWKPIANLLGLHTAYELDRVGGRYASVDDERGKPRTVESLARTKAMDLFDLRQKYTPLAFLVDAEYGSATFVDVKAPAVVEVRVSTTGLLVRPRSAAP